MNHFVFCEAFVFFFPTSKEVYLFSVIGIKYYKGATKEHPSPSPLMCATLWRSGLEGPRPQAQIGPQPYAVVHARFEDDFQSLRVSQSLLWSSLL